MENITHANLEKYEEVLQESNQVYKELKEIEEKKHYLDQELFAVNLCKMSSPAKSAVIKVKVEVKDSVFEISQLYRDNISDGELLELSKHDTHKFYVTEIYILRQIFYQMIKTGWFFNVTVTNKRLTESKTVNVPNNDISPIVVVIPFECSTEDSVVDVKLIWMKNFQSETEASKYTVLNVKTVPINISYHLRSFSELESSLMKEERICKINGCFKKNVEVFYVTRKFTYSGEISSIFETILKNSYSSLDPRKESVCLNNQNTIKMQFYADCSKNNISIIINKDNKEIEIKAPTDIMFQLTRYFASMSDKSKTIKLSDLPPKEIIQVRKLLQFMNCLLIKIIHF